MYIYSHSVKLSSHVQILLKKEKIKVAYILANQSIGQERVCMKGHLLPFGKPLKRTLKASLVRGECHVLFMHEFLFQVPLPSLYESTRSKRVRIHIILFLLLLCQRLLRGV